MTDLGFIDLGYNGTDHVEGCNMNLGHVGPCLTITTATDICRTCGEKTHSTGCWKPDIR